MHSKDIETITEILKAVSHPIRLQLLCLLLQRSQNVTDLNKHFNSTYANVAQHLSKLQKSGLVAFEKNGNFIYNYIADQRITDFIRSLSELYCLKNTDHPPEEK